MSQTTRHDEPEDRCHGRMIGSRFWCDTHDRWFIECPKPDPLHP